MELYIPLIGLFLYFPEDKSEYLPAAITMGVFTILAIFAFRYIVKLSKKEQGQVDDLIKQANEKKDSK
ncbi:phosphotransferase system glucose/maltose/N-acetylglucosamine-specific IIC component [Metabacillus crassostreae]|uniref:hypothetical protein n=1 Tax=Metabacillus crassostreae TaxID=929098 RepID=UPI001EF87C14|nr:hypothetical protein [Metabacillus crassostreae]MBM7605453.1 phosphotransferase system glucose/maltose/N-acetylglucosamine-specific IIC component [Metabacillus crassostreae]